MSTAPAPDRWYHVGPHGLFDLVRLARRGRTTLVRVLYLLALFATLYAVYENSSNQEEFRARRGRRGAQPALQESINHNARIAERFSYTILISQCVAVLLLTPIYIAASVHEERDGQALGILFTTQLTARAILQGKLLARIGHVGSVVFAGLPLLALVQLWGGIDMPMIVANFWNTLLWLISVGTFSLMIATYASSMMRSIVATYICMACTLFCAHLPMHQSGDVAFLIRPDGRFDAKPYLVILIMMYLAIAVYRFARWYNHRNPMALIGVMCGFFGCVSCWPITVWFNESPVLAFTDTYANFLVKIALLTLIHLSAAWIFLNRAVAYLEVHRTDEPIPIRQLEDEIPELSIRFWTLPEMDDDVIAWKEHYLNRTVGHLIPYCMMSLMGFFLLVLVADWADRISPNRLNRPMQSSISPFFNLVILGSFGIYTALVTFRATGCIVRESQQRTLDGILTLPLPRRDLLRSKLRGIFWRFWPWLAIALTYWGCLHIFCDPMALRGIVLLIAMSVHFVFFVVLAIFLSVRCRSTLSAYITLTLVLAGMLVGPYVAAGLLQLQGLSADLLTILNPVSCWIAFGIEKPDAAHDLGIRMQNRHNTIYGIAFISFALYVSISYVLWLGTCRRFAEEPSRAS